MPPERDYLNSARVVENKIGQGAKPGIGGHLASEKVSRDVSATKMIPGGAMPYPQHPNTTLYSVEDLRMLMYALKVAFVRGELLEGHLARRVARINPIREDETLLRKYIRGYGELFGVDVSDIEPSQFAKLVPSDDETLQTAIRLLECLL